MQVHLTGRQVEITPALRKFTEERLKKLDKLLGGTTEAHVVLAVEKRRHLAEIQVRSRTALLAGELETGDLYASIGGVVLKLERQALKHKEKLTVGKRREGRRLAPVVSIPEPSSTSSKRRVVAKLPAKVASIGPRVVAAPRYRLRPLSAQDAAAELDAAGDDILVYRDATTFRVNVVYRRKDGAFVLLDPEF